MKKLITLFSLVIGFFGVYAQNGDVSGKVVDENGEGVPFANVVIVDSKGVTTGRGTNTDADGNYSIKPLTPGKYNLQFSYVGYATQMQQGVVVNSDKSTFIDIKMKPASKELQEVQIISYKVPLIDPGKTSSQNTVTSEEIANMPTKNVSDIAATTAGVFQSDQGGGINIKGGRSDGTQYYIDGVKVTGVPTLPASSIEQLQVITGGVPAKYGDLVGGIVNITSKGPSGQFNGGVEVQTTQGLDAYGYNLVNGNLTGPLLKLKKSRKTIIGFFASFEYLHQKDPNPSAVGVWQVRPGVLDSLQQFPLIKKQTASGFNLRAETVTYKDMFKQKVKPNTQEANYRGSGRLDIRPADNVTLSFGSSLSYRQYHSWIEQYTLFNDENNPLFKELNWRVYGRFTHNIQSKQAAEDKKEGKKSAGSAFQNAFYSVQVDYEKYLVKSMDDTHNFNPFNYGYIGKFDVMRTPTFDAPNGFSTNFSYRGHNYQSYVMNGYRDTAVVFTPSNLNAFGTRYTQEYYELLNAQVNSNGGYEVYGDDNATFTRTLDEIKGNQALINGQRSNFVNNIWYNTGRQYNGYGVNNDNDQYRVRLEGAFDILKPGAPSRNKHSFEIGVEFEQRIERGYTVNPLDLWTRARQMANAHLTDLDKNNPIFRINGHDYSYDSLIYAPGGGPYYNDTIYFHRLADPAKQEFFDKSLRKSLGLDVNGTDWVNVDALSPSQLNLNMFSPDELLLNGSSLVSYRGYDAYGNRLTNQPSFDDFFKKKRADGEYERPIAAFRPIYTAAYISDRFYFKDLTFNVGVRVDRFDANQKVLKDDYSLFAIKTADGVANRPSNIGGDFAVYSDNAKNPQRVVGYRNGDTWYDVYGRELTSGKTIALASNSGNIEPWLVNNKVTSMSDTTFEPSTSFTDYKAKIIVMPRLQFSFNITDQALFFAHYDILSQRPGAQGMLDITQYMYFGNIGGALNNPNLKPQKTVDFELGFKQRVTNTSAVTISAFYREGRDLIQVKKVVNAYPKDYIEYCNCDFSSTKGFSLDYDMRRTGNISLKANYTMQFADGTGSDPTTQFNIVSATGTNFRSVNPLGYDSRHLINVNATWSYGQGKDYNGPTVKNSQILSNAGITFQLSTRSGTPYTAQALATADGLLNQASRPFSTGTINGSRQPWYFRLNMRVWKDFAFAVGKKNDKKDNKRELSFQIYLQIQNLIDTKNVISVYRFTGVPNDDGYLSDPTSLPAIQAALNPQAYKDQYAAYINRPGNYSLPRRIFLGAIFSF